jgi:hypothetical protein
MDTQSEPQRKTPKEELLGIMFEVFEIIEALDLQEGKYLQLANLFRDMNINVNRLGELRTIIINNSYYTQRERRLSTLRRKRLTEADKAKNPEYALCSCGRYFKFFGSSVRTQDFIQAHYQSMVHQQGVRNRKYANKTISNETMNELIQREVVVQGFIIKHLATLKVIEVDNENDDEVVSV